MAVTLQWSNDNEKEAIDNNDGGYNEAENTGQENEYNHESQKNNDEKHPANNGNRADGSDDEDRLVVLLEKLEAVDKAKQEIKRMERKLKSKLKNQIEFTQEKQKTLTSEIDRLRDMRRCVICFEQDANILFTACKHVKTCYDCSLGVTHCCLCRSPVGEKIRVFL